MEAWHLEHRGILFMYSGQPEPGGLWGGFAALNAALVALEPQIGVVLVRIGRFL